MAMGEPYKSRCRCTMTNGVGERAVCPEWTTNAAVLPPRIGMVGLHSALAAELLLGPGISRLGPMLYLVVSFHVKSPPLKEGFTVRFWSVYASGWALMYSVVSNPSGSHVTEIEPAGW